MGLDLGLEAAGFEVRVAVECNRFAVETAAPCELAFPDGRVLRFPASLFPDALLANALAGSRGRDRVLVLVLAREQRSARAELVAQIFGALEVATARRLAGALAPSLAPLLREPPPARSVWCLVLGPRKALVAFPA